MAQYSHFSKINPQWEQFVQSQPILRDLRNSDDHINERRAAFQQLAAEGPQIREIPGKESLRVKNFDIPARDGYRIPVRSYIPSTEPYNSSSRYPLFVYYHGGGYTFGGIETGDENCRLLCAGNKVSVLNVDYRLAPKHVFPKGIEDSHDAVKWAAANAHALQAEPSNGFIVGGVSAGANFAGVLAYLCRDEGLSPPITGLWLSIPCCLMPQAFDLVPHWKEELLSIEQNKHSDMLNVQSYKQLIIDIYKAPPSDPRISFLLNPDHTGLPPRAYFQICGLDAIRDEAFLFDRLLREHSGSKTKVDVYDGLPHGFWRFQELPAAKGWAGDLFKGTQFLLDGSNEGMEIKGYETEMAGSKGATEFKGYKGEINGVSEYISGWI